LELYNIAKLAGSNVLTSYHKKNPKEAIRLGKDLIKKLNEVFNIVKNNQVEPTETAEPAASEFPTLQPDGLGDPNAVRPFDNKLTWGTKEAGEARQRKNKIIYNLSKLAGKPVDTAAPDFDLSTTIDDISKGSPWSKLMKSPAVRDLILSKLRENFSGDGYSDDQLIKVLGTKRAYRSMMLRKIIDEEVRDTTAEEEDETVAESRRQRFKISPEIQAQIAAIAKKNVTWWEQQSKKRQDEITAKRLLSRSATEYRPDKVEEREAARQRTQDVKKHEKLGYQAQAPSKVSKRDKRAIYAKNRKLRDIGG